MLVLTCPNCGARNVAEFRYGGAKNPRPDDPVSDRAWAEYLYFRENGSGMQSEWWFHRAGCGLWFLADRNTTSNKVARTYRWHDPIGSLKATPDGR
ncbi:MAG: sarcosine oxidase subunit delta [Actinoallomurus sp.]